MTQRGQFFTKYGEKQVSRIAVNILDQNGRAKGKFLDLKTDAGEFLSSNEAFMQ